MVDDSSYLTPHETALAVVATAMKKARLQLDTLVVNSILGGILFSSGSFLLVAVHSDDPDMVAQNPGLVDLITGITFAIGLFYVVIMGADLFNSNILFFSVGIMRGAVTIYDLIISWLVSWLGNIAGSLFVSYLFGHLTGIGSQELWMKGSKQIIEQKISYSFIQTFLKGIAGNFFVCLAIYLQLMAKPIHVKFIIMSFPIITFVTIGFTHVVADMSASFIAMLNGADVSVGKYIWKLLIPASLGNIVGGIFFSAVVPFYLHLVVVERDRKRLSLPEYEARDEQPELNMDSRVVRIPKHELKEERDDVDDDDTTETGGDIEDLNEKDSTSLFINAHDSSSILTGRSLSSLSSIPSSAVTSENATMESNLGEPKSFIPIPNSTTSPSHLQLRRNRSTKSINSHYSKKHRTMRSPPGVFPVRGMGEPLEREKTIEDATYNPEDDKRFLKRAETHNFPFVKNNDNILRLVKTEQSREQNEYEENGGYNILENKPGTKLEKIITHFAEGLPLKESTPPGLPRTTQETFPYNAPASSPTYTDNIHSLNRANSTTLGGLFRAVSRDFHTSIDAEISNDPPKNKSTGGINQKASNVPGTINLDLGESSGDSRQQHLTAPKS